MVYILLFAFYLRTSYWKWLKFDRYIILVCTGYISWFSINFHEMIYLFTSVKVEKSGKLWLAIQRTKTENDSNIHEIVMHFI